MSTETKLPGIELMGFGYDVQGYYADARSVLTREQIFNFEFSSYGKSSSSAEMMLSLDPADGAKHPTFPDEDLKTEFQVGPQGDSG